MRRLSLVLVALVASTILYAANGILEYLLVRKTNVFAFFFLWSLGSLLAFPVLVRVLRLRNDLFKGISRHRDSIVGGALLVAFNLALFLAFKRFLLAGVYPLIAASSLVFFGIDTILYRGVLAPKKELVALAGITLVVIGVFLTESTGAFSSFNYGMLPYMLVIIAAGGFGYYLVLYNIRAYSVGSKIGSVVLVSFVWTHGHGCRFFPSRKSGR